MSDWKTCSIEPELCEIIAGGTPPTGNKDYWNGEVLWITPADMSKAGKRYITNSERRITVKGVKYSTGKLMPVNSVIISCRAPVGYCVISTEPFATNQGCKTLLCKNVESGYLYYYLLNSTQELVKVSSGTTFLELSKRELARFQIRMPSDLPTQKKIAEVLESIDDVIDKTREVIQKYINIKTGMMFDLLKNYSEETFIRLDNYANFFNGDRSKNYPSAADIVSEGCAFINAGHLQDGKVNYELCDYITPKKYKSLHGAKIEQGDILYCLRGTLGKNAFIEEKVVDGTVASSLVVIRPYDINNKFLFYILNSYIEEKQRHAADNGTAQPNLSALSVAAFKILAPSRPEQDHIVEVLETIDNSIEKERDVLKKYSLLKQGLMQDLLSGNIDAGKLI